MMIPNSIILMGDAYKYTHRRQYPYGTEAVYSYLESRGGRYPETVFFGLQYFIKRYEHNFQDIRQRLESALCTP